MIFGEKVHSEPGLTEALSDLFTAAFRVHNETNFETVCEWRWGELEVEVSLTSVQHSRLISLYKVQLSDRHEESIKHLQEMGENMKSLSVASIREVIADLEKVLRDGRIIIEAFDKEK